jgi:phosphohistidine phosphatase
MKQLYVLRHGIAIPHGTPGIADEDRPLTSEGEKKMREVAEGLRRLDLKLDRIVTSPLPRALRTAEIVADVLDLPDPPEQIDALSAPSRAESVKHWLSTREEDHLMIVGHNPCFEDLIALLTTGSTARSICILRKGGLAALTTQPDGNYLLEWLARPRILRL